MEISPETLTKLQAETVKLSELFYKLAVSEVVKVTQAFGSLSLGDAAVRSALTIAFAEIVANTVMISKKLNEAQRLEVAKRAHTLVGETVEKVLLEYEAMHAVVRVDSEEGS